MHTNIHTRTLTHIHQVNSTYTKPVDLLITSNQSHTSSLLIQLTNCYCMYKLLIQKHEFMSAELGKSNEVTFLASPSRSYIYQHTTDPYNLTVSVRMPLDLNDNSGVSPEQRSINQLSASVPSLVFTDCN